MLKSKPNKAKTGFLYIMCSLLVFSLLGCEVEDEINDKLNDLISEDSTGIPTDEIYMDIRFIQTVGSSSTTVKVLMHHKNFYGERIALVNNEQLSAYYNGEKSILQGEKGLLGIGYEGTINNTTVGEFTLNFHRNDGSEINSVIQMPKSFYMSSPAKEDTYFEGDRLLATWSPALEGMEMNFDGHIACLTIEDDFEVDMANEHESWETKDTGMFEFPLGKLASNMRLEAILENDELLPGTKCDFDIGAYRENKAYVAEVYAEGSVISARVGVNIQDMSFYIN
jgi:hypothetical protein